MLRCPGSGRAKVEGFAAVCDQQARDWCDDSNDGLGCEGYADDGSFGEVDSWSTGGEGYNAGGQPPS